jgi:hypothetical protein
MAFFYSLVSLFLKGSQPNPSIDDPCGLLTLASMGSVIVRGSLFKLRSLLLLLPWFPLSGSWQDLKLGGLIAFGLDRCKAMAWLCQPTWPRL